MFFMNKRVGLLLIASLFLFSCQGKGEPTFSHDSALPTVTTSIQSLEILEYPNKRVYLEGEYFSKAGMRLQATKEDGSKEIVKNSDIEISPKTPLTKGLESVRATYLNLYVDIDIQVNELSLKSLSITHLPYVSTYSKGDLLDLQGLTLVGITTNGEERSIDYSLCSFSVQETSIQEGEEINLDSGTYQVSIQYASASCYFDIKVINGVKVEAEDITFGDVKENVKAYVKVKENSNSEYLKAPNENGKIRAISDDSAQYASGKSYLGDINTGNIIDLYFYSEIGREADISICASSCYLLNGIEWLPIEMGDEHISRLFKVQANGENVLISGDIILKGSKSKDGQPDYSLWTNWKEVTFSSMTVLEGWNLLSMEIISDYTNYLGYSCSFNLDYFSIDFTQ